ncbi:MAG: hypothetical protein GC201_01080 [Alphaproteobacteria bacterium]|nr:hypothetical protein [Alphaproteobacteria bacterium]
MEIHKIRLTHIRVAPRQRPLNNDAIERLMASIREIGLRQPISVRLASEVTTIDGEVLQNVPVLVAGHHRLEALRRLGWTHADCIEVSSDDMIAELWEIDENLIRNELSPSQKAKHLKRRQEIWEGLTAGTSGAASLGDGRAAGPQHQKSFAADTRSVTGLSKGNVNEALARANALGDDLDAISGTSLDKGVEMDALAKMDPEARAGIIARAKAGEVVSARRLADYSESVDAAYEREWRNLCREWNRSCRDVREDFAKAIEDAKTEDGYEAV